MATPTVSTLSKASAPRKMTYAEYRAMPDDGKRYELVFGVLREMPSPNTSHQQISMVLSVKLFTFVSENKLGKVFAAPLDVHIADDLNYQPDLLFIANNSKAVITENYVEGSPDLVIEIVSPSSTRTDRKEKLENYFTFGVREYWIVYPDSTLIEVYGARNGTFQMLGRYFEGEVITSEVLTGLNLNTAPLFED